MNPQTVWAVGLGKYIAKTTDGGINWQEVKLDMIPEVHLFAVTVDHNKNVFIGGNGVLIVSADGGTTFKHADVDPALTYSWIGDIKQRGKNGLVAVGIKASVYKLSKSPFGKWSLAQYK